MPSLPLARRRATRVVGASLAATSALLLSGCVQITSQEAAQQDVVGDVTVSLEVCQNGSFGSSLTQPGCRDSANASGRDAQLFVSYIVPTTAQAPVTLELEDAPAGTTFSLDPDSAEILNENKPPLPQGYQRVTYASSAITPIDGNDGPLNGTINATFKTRSIDGNFNYGASLSWRWVSNDADYPLPRPIDCDTATTNWTTPTRVLAGTACDTATVPANLFSVLTTGRSGEPDSIDAPTASTPQPTTMVAGRTFFTLPLNQLELEVKVDGEPRPSIATPNAGSTVKVTFAKTSHRAGEAPVSLGGLHGSTTLPGAKVTTEPTLSVGDDADVVAEVAIPDDAKSGTYDVKVKAGEGTGMRWATTQLEVVAKPTPPAADPTPVPTVAATPLPTVSPTPAPVSIPKAIEQAGASLKSIVQGDKKTDQLRRGAATVPVAVPAAGTVRVSITGRTKVGKRFPVYAVGTRYTGRAGTINVTIKRTKEGREILRREGTVKADLTVRFFGQPNAKVVKTTVPITLD